MTTVRPSIPD